MTNPTAQTSSISRRYPSLLATILGLALTSACGNLDEQDTWSPSVLALTRWDATHVLALRLNFKEPVILDLATGRQTGQLDVATYYQDIESLDNGAFIASNYQSLDYLESNGRIKYSVSGHLFLDSVVSGDHTTLAYADNVDGQVSFIGVTSLMPATIRRYSPAGLHPDLNSESLALSTDGTLLAFLQDWEIGLAKTDDYNHPAEVPTCTIDQGPETWGIPRALAMSPVESKLALFTSDGFLRVFDVGQYPSCTMLLKVAASTDVQSTFSPLLRYSPNGSAIALAVSSQGSAPEAFTWNNEVRLFDASTGAAAGVLPIDSGESPMGTAAHFISDMQWSDGGDQLTVAGQAMDVQHWDLATATLLWSAKL
jgi:WD40 repeat protein